jgi:chromosomal replication initiator protein
MQDIEQRLLSRFKWGLSAELHQPDYETSFNLKIFCIVTV